MTKYYVDANGGYLGAFDGAVAPDGSVEVGTPPQDARQVWDGTQWGEFIAVPQSITPRQCQLYLDNLGMLDSVELAIEGMARSSRIEWQKATEIRRDHPLVTQMAALLNWTEAQMDTYFIEAAKL